MKILQGVYTGNGVDDRDISPPGWTSIPLMLLIKRNASMESVFRVGTVTGDSTFILSSFTEQANLIQAITASGFQIGTGAQVNANGSTYYWIAIFDTGAGNTAQGSYVGNGSSQSINVGFQPDFVLIRREGEHAVWRTAEITGLSSVNTMNNSSALVNNGITGLTATGFNVGTNSRVNSNGLTHHYLALKNTPNVFQTFSYTGDDTDNRAITNSGWFEPEFAYVGAAAGQHKWVRFKDLAGDQSLPLSNLSGIAANRIQAFLANGIEVGTDADVNASGKAYYGFIMRSASQRRRIIIAC